MFDHRRVLISTCNWDTGIVTHTHTSVMLLTIKGNMVSSSRNILKMVSSKRSRLRQGSSNSSQASLPSSRNRSRHRGIPWQLLRSHVFRHRSAVLDCWTWEALHQVQLAANGQGLPWQRSGRSWSSRRYATPLRGYAWLWRSCSFCCRRGSGGRFCFCVAPHLLFRLPWAFVCFISFSSSSSSSSWTVLSCGAVATVVVLALACCHRGPVVGLVFDALTIGMSHQVPSIQKWNKDK